MQLKFFGISLVLLLAINQTIALELPTPIFDNALFSENQYEALIVGNEVLCRLDWTPEIQPVHFLKKSVLTIENDQNEKIFETIVTTENCSITLNTRKLNVSNTYSCCIHVNASEVDSKCSVLKLKSRSRFDFTFFAKTIGLLEMLAILCLFSICLGTICMRFKRRQKKSEQNIEAAQKDIDSNSVETKKKFGRGGPYLISPNAKYLETRVRFSQANEKAFRSEKTDGNPDLKSFDDFPPTYEEIVLRRIEHQLETGRY